LENQISRIFGANLPALPAIQHRLKFNPFAFALLLSLQYAGTNAEFTKADSVIFRSDLYNFTNGRKEANFKRTVKYDSKLLDSKYSRYLSCNIYIINEQSVKLLTVLTKVM